MRGAARYLRRLRYLEYLFFRPAIDAFLRFPAGSEGAFLLMAGTIPRYRAFLFRTRLNRGNRLSSTGCPPLPTVAGSPL